MIECPMSRVPEHEETRWEPDDEVRFTRSKREFARGRIMVPERATPYLKEGGGRILEADMMLRHRFPIPGTREDWSYATTDIPKRVSEVFGIPIPRTREEFGQRGRVKVPQEAGLALRTLEAAAGVEPAHAATEAAVGAVRAIPEVVIGANPGDMRREMAEIASAEAFDSVRSDAMRTTGIGAAVGGMTAIPLIRQAWRRAQALKAPRRRPNFQTPKRKPRTVRPEKGVRTTRIIRAGAPRPPYVAPPMHFNANEWLAKMMA